MVRSLWLFYKRGEIFLCYYTECQCKSGSSSDLDTSDGESPENYFSNSDSSHGLNFNLPADDNFLKPLIIFRIIVPKTYDIYSSLGLT